LITLHTAWQRQGEKRLLEDHLPAAERCLQWIDEFGDCDGDGFQEYQTRSSDGLQNQSWKDSGKAIVHADGSDVKAPKALCELQGYVYDAWLRMAHIYDALAQPKAANRLRKKAQDLFDRFNEKFWDEDLATYVLALDGDKRPARSIASNAGHCLWSGIVPKQRAARVAARLMQADMFGTFGIRTLSNTHPSFNPLHYQVGAIWPHDNGLIGQGMKRYSLNDEVQTIASALIRAASVFERKQMPELYGDLAPANGAFPCRYVGANIPQAWAAGSCFSILQSLLGCQPDAPHGKLYVDPSLPDWMPRLTLRNFRIAGFSLDIRFKRNDDRTEFDVVRGPAHMVEFRPMTSWHDRLKAGGL
jgi:glycogen debranching enzyme